MNEKHWATSNRLPYQKHSSTSKEAAQAIKHRAGSIRQRVYEALLSCGADGATDDEVVVMLDGMNASTTRPRRIELVNLGAAYKTDQKRKTRAGRWACVYRAIEGVDITKKQGRPPTPPDSALSHKLTVYLTKKQKLKLDRLAAQDARSTAEVARQCIGIGWQQLADARRFYHDQQWSDDTGQ
jgi:hypothetical protein